MHGVNIKEQFYFTTILCMQHHFVKLNFFNKYTRCNFYLQELFKRLIPHQCLGSVWSRRGEKPGGVGGLAGGAAGSVLATVNQFNAVSLRVISTTLASTVQQRAQILTAWINIAQVKYMWCLFFNMQEGTN